MSARKQIKKKKTYVKSVPYVLVNKKECSCGFASIMISRILMWAFFGHLHVKNVFVYIYYLFEIAFQSPIDSGVSGKWSKCACLTDIASWNF